MGTDTRLTRCEEGKEQAEEWDATCSYTHGIAYSGAAIPSIY